MSKPLNEFGGWLTFFNVSLWSKFIMIILVSIVLLFSFFKISNPAYVLGIMITFVRYLISGFLFFKMIKLVRQKEGVVPDKIIQLLAWYVLIAIFFVLFIWVFSNFSHNDTLIKLRMEFLKFGLSTIGFGLIWGSYLKKSKRVCAYYGKNAFTKE